MRPDTDHMQQVAFTIGSPNHYVEEWTYLQNGKEDTTRFDFHGKKLPPGNRYLREKKLSAVPMAKNVEKGDDISSSVGALPSRLTIRLHGQLPTGATLSNPDPQ